MSVADPNDRTTVVAANARLHTWTLRPDGRVVAISLRWAALLLVLFVAIYGTTNWLSAQRADRVRLWFEWELAIPLLPVMIWPYLSLGLAFFLPMFALGEPRVHALCRRLALATIVSGVCFLCFPAELGYTRAAHVPAHDLAFRLVHSLDLPHNLIPSLHVSWSLIVLLTLRSATAGYARRVLEIWLALLLVAVIGTHQHHVLDVAGGILVALLAYVAVRRDGAWVVPKGRSS